MDILHMPDSPTADAPPAYEFSQQELDQKVAAAVERSIASEEDDRRQRANKRSNSGDFEVWDENAYQEAARMLAERYSTSQHPSSSGAGSSTVTYIQDTFEPNPYADEPETEQSIRPLSFQKRNRAAQRPVVGSRRETKERPSWYMEAQLDGRSTQTTQTQNISSSNANRRQVPTSGLQQPLDCSSVVSDGSDDGHHVIPPPPFVAVDNSLDGPAYERYASHQRRQSGSQVVLRYSGDLSVSPPNSPPQPPTRLNSQLRNPYDTLALQQDLPYPQTLLQQQQARRSPQPQRQHARSTPPRPSSTSDIKIPPPSVPRMDFSLSVAYGKSSYGEQPMEAPSASGGAAALYNSAVASLLPAGQTGSRSTASPASPQGRRPISSMEVPRSTDSHRFRPQHQYTQSFNPPNHYQPSVDPNRISLYPQQVNVGYAQPLPPHAMRPVSSLSHGEQPHWQQSVHVQQQLHPR